MSPHQAIDRARSLTGARGDRAAHGARGNRDEGDNDNHHESVMGGRANAFGGNIWVVGSAPLMVISGTEFIQGVFTAIKQVVRNTVHEMLVPAGTADTKAIIREGVNETRRITHPKSQREGGADLVWLSPIGTSGCGLPTEELAEAVTTRGILSRAGAGAVTMHKEEEHSGSFGSEGSEDLGVGLRYGISNGTIRDSRTTGATVGCLCCTRYFSYI
ncbi:hypothetical protein Acr_18g0007680 [Actinidia rufa]|uniref:Uncharacterized protein n=1 Tax=Actinidia rufa TaxID=165716 RepID=A0A7J0G740_9ERIC|nr:hypothetical protein Acr_18g0007680 [Actinidia rufa]